MTLPDLFLALATAGIRLSVDSGRLTAKGPPGVMTDAIKAALTEHRGEIEAALGLVRSDAENPAEQDPERAAIQWVENLSDTDGRRVLAEALEEWRAITATGDGIPPGWIEIDNERGLPMFVDRDHLDAVRLFDRWRTAS